MEESFKQELMCPLTVDELNTYSGQLARATAKRIGISEQKKAAASAFAAQIKEIDVEIRELATKINEGYERRLVEVRWEFDLDNLRKSLRRLDTFELVVGHTDIPLTPEERQMNMFPVEKTEEPEAQEKTAKSEDGPDHDKPRKRKWQPRTVTS